MQEFLSHFLKFHVVSNSPFGRGCTAINPIEEGEIICKMTGPIITLRELFDKYEGNSCNPLQVSDAEYLDLIEPYVCFNHSCDPNAGIRNDGILFALKNISPGEEIFYDYSTTTDDLTWKLECLCGSKNCRKIVGDFQSIPHEQKQYYFAKNALTRYIKYLYF